ncbi:hypothetical protein ACWPMX_00055 [Tsuneonella sp. HG094]
MLVTVQEDAARTVHVTDAAVHLLNVRSEALPSTVKNLRLRMRIERKDGTVLDAVVGFLNRYTRW